MKRRIGLLLCTAMILTAFSGCMVKKQSSTTGETSNEITVEITPEVTVETTPNTTEEPAKEQPDVNVNSEDNKNTDNTHQNLSKPNENYNKTEPTPEFYDFMTLDPNVNINNKQVRENIRKKIIEYFDSDYVEIPFTKKEIYLFNLFSKYDWKREVDIDFHLKLNTKDFYSNKTRKMITDLGFSIHQVNSEPVKETDTPFEKSIKFMYYVAYNIPSNETQEQYIEKAEQVLKILLQDHNVAYVDIPTVIKVPN